ncbi:MAG: hypothetical protein EBS90_10040 [Betaproteobacteria bacterium]|nr:hypothetical protein [Betaproteobacteria bacterium]
MSNDSFSFEVEELDSSASKVRILFRGIPVGEMTCVEMRKNAIEVFTDIFDPLDPTEHCHWVTASE